MSAITVIVEILEHIRHSVRNNTTRTFRSLYSIPCECGEEFVGETGRTLRQRMTEHKRAVRNSDPNNALAVHVSKMHHDIKWEEAKLLTREEHWTKRKIKEGLAIRSRDSNMNLDQGFQLDSNMDPDTIACTVLLLSI